MKNEVTIEGDKFRIILYHEKNERGSRTIDVRTSKNGGVIVGGYDLGPAIENLLGHDDYDYDAAVAAEDKLTLYATLKKELFDNHDDFMS